MVPLVRIGLTTPSLPMTCSTTELQRQDIKFFYEHILANDVPSASKLNTVAYRFPFSLRCSEELADKFDTSVSNLLSVTTELQRHNYQTGVNIHNAFFKINIFFYFFLIFTHYCVFQGCGYAFCLFKIWQNLIQCFQVC